MIFLLMAYKHGTPPLEIANKAKSLEVRAIQIHKSGVWSLRDDYFKVKDMFFQDIGGTVSVRPNGTLQFFTEKGGKRIINVILWNAPLNDWDAKHMEGDGRIYQPKNPAIVEWRLSWSVL